MPNLTSVTLTNGVPTAGTGTVSTIDELLTFVNSNGQTTMANSSPVTIAVDQSSVPIQFSNGNIVDESGTIAAGGTSQTLAVTNASRKRIIIQNPSTAAGQGIGAAESLYINFTSPAGIDNGSSLELLPGATFDSDAGPVTPQAINVNATTTGHQYIAKEM